MLLKRKGKDTFFIPPRKGARATEAFQSSFSHTDGKDGCGREVVVVGTEHSPYL
jgi:hypothetical protein